MLSIGGISVAVLWFILGFKYYTDGNITKIVGPKTAVMLSVISWLLGVLLIGAAFYGEGFQS